jgi:hypothetical protein
LDSPSIDGTTSFYYTESLVSLLGRLNYSYLGKYMMSASSGQMEAQVLQGNKWGTFPAFSAVGVHLKKNS